MASGPSGHQRCGVSPHLAGAQQLNSIPTRLLCPPTCPALPVPPRGRRLGSSQNLTWLFTVASLQRRAGWVTSGAGGLITEAHWLGYIRSRGACLFKLRPHLSPEVGGGRVPLATSQYPSGLSESHLININPAVGERGFFRGTGTRLSFAVLEPFRELGAKDAPRAPGSRRPSEHERGRGRPSSQWRRLPPGPWRSSCGTDIVSP